MMLFFIYLIDNSEHRGNLQKNDKCGFTHLLGVGLYFQKDGHLTASTSLEIHASVPSIPSTYIIIAFHVLFICHESEHFPKALFKSDGHLAGPGIVIVVEEAVSVLCFLLHCCTAVHPTYARDLTIGWTGEKWRVGSKQMVALYKTAGRDVQMLSFEGAASSTPTYRPPAFHNLTPPS